MIFTEPQGLSRKAPASFLLLLCYVMLLCYLVVQTLAFSLFRARVCVCMCIRECIHTRDRVYISRIRICILWRLCIYPAYLQQPQMLSMQDTSFSTAAVFKKHRFFLVDIVLHAVYFIRDTFIRDTSLYFLGLIK